MSGAADFSAPERDRRLGSDCVYRSWGSYSYGVIGAYLVLLILAVLTVPGSLISGGWYVPYLLYAIILFFLARYLSTHYTIDADRLHAARILGSRRVNLHQVRKIQFSNLRDLSPGGFFGSWGWRGRMWTPSLGSVDAIYTGSRGVMITAEGVPLFVSPRDPVAFARELSRRVRSYRGPLLVDDGAPPAA